MAAFWSWEDAGDVPVYNWIDGCVSAGGNLLWVDGLEGRYRRNAAGDRCPAVPPNDVAESADFQQSIIQRHLPAPSRHDASGEGDVGRAQVQILLPRPIKSKACANYSRANRKNA